MKIVVGLGNPGVKYETTRHNAGFLAVDRLIDDWKAQGPDDAYEGLVWKASVRGEKVLLVKPQTFMNLSGKTVGPLMKFYKCAPDDLIVIHDEVDLPALTLRLKTGGGSGGHNGLRSIDQHLGAAANNYHRVRIGVAKPLPGSPISTADHVLQPFTDEELEKLDPLLDRAARAIEMVIAGEVRDAMTEYNRKDQ